MASFFETSQYITQTEFWQDRIFLFTRELIDAENRKTILLGTEEMGFQSNTKFSEMVEMVEMVQ